MRASVPALAVMLKISVYGQASVPAQSVSVVLANRAGMEACPYRS